MIVINKNIKKLVSLISAVAAITSIMGVCIAANYTEADVTNLKKQINELENLQDHAHTMAESARALGLPETDNVILTAKDFWHSHDETKLELMAELKEAEAYVEANKQHRYSKAVASMSSYDIELLYRITYHEAGNQCDEGQQAVAEVVLNRMINSRFPNTLQGVLFQKGQFCSESELMQSKYAPTEQVKRNVNLVMQGKTNNLPNNVVYFATSPINNRPYKKIQDHWFCYI